MTDLVVAVFVAILVVAGLYVPRWGDAVGRRLRGGAPDSGEQAAPPEGGRGERAGERREG